MVASQSRLSLLCVFPSGLCFHCNIGTYLPGLPVAPHLTVLVVFTDCPGGLFLFMFLFLIFFFYNVVLVSGVQQSESVIHIHISTLFFFF